LGDHVGDRLVLPDRHAPLLPLVRPAATDLETPLREPGTGGRQSQPSGVQRDERDLEPLALLADDVFARDVDVLEADDPVRERLETHEATAMLDLHAWPVGLDDEADDL